MYKKTINFVVILLMMVILLFLNFTIDAKKTDISIVLSDDLMKANNIPIMACWLAYASDLSNNIGKEINKKDKEIKISFENELSARTTLVQVWKELKAKDQLTNSYLDDLEKVYDNKYLPEYVYNYLKKEYWPVKDDLKIDEFNQWVKDNLKDHQVLTLAYVTLDK